VTARLTLKPQRADGAALSRLDFMISRLTAQRALIEEAARLIADVPGCVFELGLGSGRTFDHLRQALPGREIFAFDRAISAHPKCIPDGDHLILGEIRETLKFCAPRIPGKPVFIHVDLGSGDSTQDLITRAWLSPLIAEWSEPGTIVLADRPLEGSFRDLPRPPGCPKSGHALLRAE
jgi:S-adenosyl-L-methionine methyltransferase